MKNILAENMRRFKTKNLGSNDNRLIKEAKSVDDAFMMKVANLGTDEFFGFLDDIRYEDNTPEWTKYTLGWINKQLERVNANLIAKGAKIDEDGNIEWEVVARNTPNSEINYEDLEIKVDYVLYETNTQSVTWNTEGDLTDENFVKETIEQIVNNVESENIRNPETGEYEFDVTSIEDGKIVFDCEIAVGEYEIDLRATYDTDGTLQDIYISDPEIAEPIGLTDQKLYEFLF